MIKKYINKITHGDCLDVLKELPDKCIDLILTDPPYGLKFGEYNRTNKTKDGTRYKANKYKNSSWDDGIPKDEIFEEMFRVSKIKLYLVAIIFQFFGNMAEKVLFFGTKINRLKILQMAN